MSQISMHEIAGKWHVVETNFPMWLKGDKLNPTLNYTMVLRSDQEVLLDEVKYEQSGKIKTISGYDYPDTENPNGYIWQGKGLLYFFKSKWEIILADPHKQWAVSWFSKTLFTPEGVEIISRTATLPETTIAAIKEAMKHDAMLAKFVNTLKPLPKK